MYNFNINKYAVLKYMGMENLHMPNMITVNFSILSITIYSVYQKCNHIIDHLIITVVNKQ